VLVLLLIAGCGVRIESKPAPTTPPTTSSTTTTVAGVLCRTDDGHEYRTGRVSALGRPDECGDR
jgi:hypothetical protein